MKSLFVKVVTFSFALVSTVAISDSKVSWKNPESYKDIEAAEESQKKFEKRLFSSLEKYFTKLSKDMPKDHKLSIEVTDIDLAGRVLPGITYGGQTPRKYRIIEHHYFPTMVFSYTVTDSNGKVLSSGDVTLKDISFTSRIRSVAEQRDAFSFEKRMLKKWYKKTFPSK